MEIWLSQLCGDDAIITTIAPEDEEIRHKLGYRSPQNYEIPLQRYSMKDWGRWIIKRRKPDRFRNHDSARRARLYYGDYYADCFSFCFERNPWDKVVSLYYYSLYQQDIGPEDFSISDLIDVVPYRISNWDRYTDEHDKIIVDYVARLENLDDELDEICRRIGVSRERMGTLPRAKTGYRKTKKPYQELLTSDQRDRIAELCSKEIDHFGYTFHE